MVCLGMRGLTASPFTYVHFFLQLSKRNRQVVDALVHPNLGEYLKGVYTVIIRGSAYNVT